MSLTQARLIFFSTLIIHLLLIYEHIGEAKCQKFSEFIDYLPGSHLLPLILSSPHGGEYYPRDMSTQLPDRILGCWNESQGACEWRQGCVEDKTDKKKCLPTHDIDQYTLELGHTLREWLCKLFLGHCPSLVANKLNRIKLDMNREPNEATFGSPLAIQIFNAYHGYIDEEKSRHSAGLFIDIHGQSHPIERAELGYLLRGYVLDDDSQTTTILPCNTSIRSLGERSKLPFDEILRGNYSLGFFLEQNGYMAVPSPTYRGPGRDNIYYNGGYNTRRHGSYLGGNIDAIQIESARPPRQPENRGRYARLLACAIHRFICVHYLEVGMEYLSENQTGNIFGMKFIDYNSTDDKDYNNREKNTTLPTMCNNERVKIDCVQNCFSVLSCNRLFVSLVLLMVFLILLVQ